MATPQPGVWGIDLGQCALKAIRLEFVNNEVTATAFDYIEHPKILSQPDADPDELTRAALQQFLSRNTLKGDVVVISVPGQSGLARFVKLPPVEEKKIADIVRFEAKQQIPFPLEEVVWDFQRVGSGVVTDGFAMETEIGLFAMKRDMVNRAIQQFRDVNVEVHVIQMAPLALCNYVAYDLLNKTGTGAGQTADGKGGCIVALDIGTDNSNLVITDGEKIIWQRPIPIGGNHFTRALTKDMKLTFAKAEHLKRNAVKSPDLKKILASLRPVLNDFVGEVQRSLGYFTNTHRDAQIQFMIGMGNAFRLPGMQKYLQEKLQLEVKKLGSLERVKGDEVTKAPAFAENVLSFGVAVGLSLQGLKLTRLQTNLLPGEIRVERLIRAKKPWAAAAAAALLLAVAGLTVGYSFEKRAVTGSKIDAAMTEAKGVIEKSRGYNTERDGHVQKGQQSKEVVRKIAAGIEERFNWQLFHQYVNMSLPRPNGDKLTRISRRKDRPKETYDTAEAKRAFQMLEEKRFAKNTGVADPKEAAKADEFIKKHLIQINIEGITPLYTEDLATFFQNVYKVTDLLRGLSPAEREIVEKLGKAQDQAAVDDAKTKLPPKAWVIEIRGYTYHKDGVAFVENTILENLALPEMVDNKLTKEMEKHIRNRISFLFVFNNISVQNPDPNMFAHIQRSMLRSLLGEAGFGMGGGMGEAGMKMPAAAGGQAAPAAPAAPGGEAAPGAGQEKPARDGWRPIGEIAASVFGEGGFGIGGLGGGLNVPPLGDAVGGGPGVLPAPGAPVMPGKGPAFVAPANANRQPRTEFIIFFVWREPLPEESTPATPTETPATDAPAAEPKKL
ncbi:MAG: type IV pilus assembly protein PilM [Gemmataceae bacterium]|nr:type IV pilus assembly protein PilM [Gemmataceae bacterium]